MRTTLTLDDDVLEAARAIADRDRRTIGAVVSALARAALAPSEASPTFRNGIMLLPVQPGAIPTTLDMVNALRDEIE